MSTTQPELKFTDETLVFDGLQPQENNRRSKLPWYRGKSNSKSIPQQVQASKVSRGTEDDSVKPTKLCFTNVFYVLTLYSTYVFYAFTYV